MAMDYIDEATNYRLIVGVRGLDPYSQPQFLIFDILSPKSHLRHPKAWKQYSRVGSSLEVWLF